MTDDIKTRLPDCLILAPDATGEAGTAGQGLHVTGTGEEPQMLKANESAAQVNAEVTGTTPMLTAPGPLSCTPFYSSSPWLLFPTRATFMIIFENLAL